MSRIARKLAVSGMLAIALGLAVPALRADEAGTRDIPPAFAPLEYLVGQWNGQAMPKDSAQSFRGWPETHTWAWTFAKGKPTAMTVAIAAEPRYVPAIMGFLPTVSKSRPSSSGPRKLPTAKTIRKTGTKPEDTPQNVE